ncbi:hypothetical protein [Streptomyces telluris]|uniref:Uncharacterized protein n=1 Tax=Streptomyces telluris TaxID=2720021 RepID=A0A9X2RKK5_9ACTN|nr:hypothetical protein [Streptomyces telluris]MCQ8769888.1 hypothetical protein [Streptomyces telluris]NJP80112.1 hypothetical protein [Streptomyces telluris]
MSKQQAGLYEPLPAAPRSYARPGGPSGYGAAVWPPPVPDRRGGRGKVMAAVAIGSLILMCTLLGGFLLLTGGGSSAHGGARYRLTAPERAGDFLRDAPVDRTFRADHLERLRRLGVRDAGSVTAGYASGPARSGMLMYSGLWGEVRDPERAVDGMFEAMAEDARERPVKQGTREEIEGSPVRVIPRGLNDAGAVMKCQAVQFTPADGGTGAGLPLSYCVWADHSTVGVVGAALGAGAGIAEAAEAAGELRAAARTPR